MFYNNCTKNNSCFKHSYDMNNYHFKTVVTRTIILQKIAVARINIIIKHSCDKNNKCFKTYS